MEIKTRNAERKPLSISEWNDATPAYIRALSGFESLVFNDLFVTFYNKEYDEETRFNAGFNAALMCLVGEGNEPLLVEDDRETIKQASFQPLFRMFAVQMSNQGEVVETAKKN